MNSLPKEFEYVGDGENLPDKIQNMAANHSTDILLYTDSLEWRPRFYPKTPLFPTTQYAFRIGSPIHHAWKQEAQPMKYEVGKTYKVLNWDKFILPSEYNRKADFPISPKGTNRFTVESIDSYEFARIGIYPIASPEDLEKGYVVPVEDEPIHHA